MPCNADYMDPNDQERQLSQVACLLDELEGRQWSKQEWRGMHPRVYGQPINPDAIVAELCAKLRDADVSRYSLELQTWWRDHQEADRQREATEKEAERQKSTTPAFILDVLKLFAEFEIEIMLCWRTDGEYAPITFWMSANDMMAWGCADGEDITYKTLPVLRKALQDCADAMGKPSHCVGVEGCMLYVCRMRGMRPQGAAYPKEKELWPLFDECGPPREVGFGNPCEPGTYKRPKYHSLPQEQFETLAGTNMMHCDDPNGPGHIECPVCGGKVSMKWKDGRQLTEDSEVPHHKHCPVEYARTKLYGEQQAAKEEDGIRSDRTTQPEV